MMNNNSLPETLGTIVGSGVGGAIFGLVGFARARTVGYSYDDAVVVGIQIFVVFVLFGVGWLVAIKARDRWK